MKDNRRDFIKKGTLLATALSIGGVGSIAAAASHDPHINKNIASPNKAISNINYVKDAGIKICIAFFGGPDPQRVAFAREMGVLGAVGGIDTRMVNMKGANPWDYEAIKAVKEAWDKLGFKLTVIEGPPSLSVKTKLGLPGRDQEIENFITFMKNMSRAGIFTICYNWMPIIGWFRTNKSFPVRGGATDMAFNIHDVEGGPITKYGKITADGKWKTLEYFLRAVIPEAEKYGVTLSMHPDDPPVPELRVIPRIMTSVSAFKKMLDIYPSPSNTITWDGSFGEMGEKNNPVDLPAAMEYFCKKKAVSFVHFRNVRGYKDDFHETFIDNGQMDMARLMKILYDNHYTGPLRPDHVPTMYGDTSGQPGYTNLGTLFAVGYIRGLIDSCRGTTLVK